ncbi:MAG: hypothetical protein HY823_05395 [Acidobacteria bacterium]|nr:hypothetical protein [Acidobacteriota bacterium]
MRNRTLIVALAALLAGGILGFAGAAKAYEKTGTVKSVEGDSFELDFGKEVWRFYTDGATAGKDALKAGQKVTVSYKQVATKIEAKGEAKKADAKPAKKK